MKKLGTKTVTTQKKKEKCACSTVVWNKGKQDQRYTHHSKYSCGNGEIGIVKAKFN